VAALISPGQLAAAAATGCDLEEHDAGKHMAAKKSTSVQRWFAMFSDAESGVAR
jgi:hypothetical protein